MLEDIKFRKIEQLLLQELNSPAYQVNDKLESETAMVKKFQVSKVTVRSALRRLEDAGILLCEHGKRRVLLQKPQDIRKIRSGMNFGIFLLGEFFSGSNDLLEISRGLAGGLHEWNADLTVFPMASNSSEFDFVKRVVNRNMIDGLFISGMKEGQKIIEYMKSLKLPCVALDFMDNSRKNNMAIPQVRLRELATLNSYVSNFKKTWVIGSSGIALDRTCSLLDKKQNWEIQSIPFDEREKKLAQIIKTLKKDELVLIASLDILSLYDLLVQKRTDQDFKKNTLVFKHCPVDLSPYKGRYMLFDRPVEKIGEKAAQLMREVILHKDNNEDLYGDDNIMVDAVIREI